MEVLVEVVRYRCSYQQVGCNPRAVTHHHGETGRHTCRPPQAQQALPADHGTKQLHPLAMAHPLVVVEMGSSASRQPHQNLPPAHRFRGGKVTHSALALASTVPEAERCRSCIEHVLLRGRHHCCQERAVFDTLRLCIAAPRHLQRLRDALTNALVHPSLAHVLRVKQRSEELLR